MRHEREGTFRNSGGAASSRGDRGASPGKRTQAQSLRQRAPEQPPVSERLVQPRAENAPEPGFDTHADGAPVPDGFAATFPTEHAEKLDGTLESSEERHKAVEQIAAVAQKLGYFRTASQLGAYKSKLHLDAEFRNDEWEKLRRQGRLGETPGER